MPLYYFRAPDDDEGTELPDDQAAREQAVRLFGQMLIDGELQPDEQMIVTDDLGRLVVQLSFSAKQ